MENEMEMEMETVVETSEESEESGGSPVGLILAAGGMLLGGALWIKRKFFPGRKYGEVIRHERFGRTE